VSDTRHRRPYVRNSDPANLGNPPLVMSDTAITQKGSGVFYPFGDDFDFSLLPDGRAIESG